MFKFFLMTSQKQNMLSGKLYDAMDPRLVAERTQARLLLKALNDSPDNRPDLRTQILRELLPRAGSNLTIQPPFYCDYGYNIITGEGVFFNFNCVVLDVMPVNIGHRVLFGPSVQLYTATHPMNASERAGGLEYAKAITIGDDVWIGGGAIICPGVTIGNGAVIGAGSIVNRDIPGGVFAAGNPALVKYIIENQQKT